MAIRFTADNFSIINGTSSQFLKADGSIDSSVYLTSTGVVIIDDITPTVVTGNLWYNPSSGVMSIGLGGYWVVASGVAGTDGTNGANGTNGTNGTNGINAISSGGTGSILSLTTTSGNYYNMSSASAITTYTTTGTILGAYAVSLINTATQPIVTGGTLITGAPWTINTNMHLVVQYFGVTVQYYFLTL